MRLLTLFLATAMCVPAAGRTIMVPDTHRTIQEAVEASQSGDRILVAPGTYREGIVLNGKAITLEAADGPSRTVLDATGLKTSVLTAEGATSGIASIKGFRLTGGLGSLIREGGQLTIGGGMLIRGGSLLVENCRIMGNAVTYEGGGAWVGEKGSVRFVRCTFSANTAERGGGAFVTSSTATFVDCRFISNKAMFGGGGIAVDSGGNVDVLDSRIEECRAAYNGGGVYVYDATANLQRTTFVRNSSGLSGGAIYQGYHAKVATDEIAYKTIGDTVFGQWHADLAAPKGACCIETLCIEVTRAACVEAGGRWAGAGTDCVAVQAAMCPVPLPGDLNNDATVDIRDVGILMSLWGERESRAE